MEADKRVGKKRRHKKQNKKKQNQIIDLKRRKKNWFRAIEGRWEVAGESGKEINEE